MRLQRTSGTNHFRKRPATRLSKPVKRALVLLALVSACGACAQHPQPVANKAAEAEAKVQSPLPPATGFVNDYANVFDPVAKKQLEMLLTDLRDKASIEFAVVTVDTTNGQPIFDYSLAVARGWGVGPKDKSKGGGLLLLLSVKDRQWRLQVSRSLEKDLPDDVCKELGDQSIELYKQGRYDEGIVKYVDSIIQRLQKLRGFSIKPGQTNSAFRSFRN
jgi:uncharacterized protein